MARVRAAVTMAEPPIPDIAVDNPSGEAPSLVLDDGTAPFDPRVGCADLDGPTEALLPWCIEMAQGETARAAISDRFGAGARAA